MQGHTGYVVCLCFSPDGRLLASGSTDNTVTLWNTSTGRILHTYTFSKPSSAGVCAVYFNAGKLLVFLVKRTDQLSAVNSLTIRTVPIYADEIV